MISRIGTTEIINITEPDSSADADQLKPKKVDIDPSLYEFKKATAVELTFSPKEKAGQKENRKLTYSSIYDRYKPGRKLSPAEETELQELKRVDMAVRAHERQHFFAAGAYAMGGPQFHYKIGPDGKRYAFIGHVDMEMSIDLSDPNKALQKAEVIKKAAGAPLDPSPTDMAVAAMAQAAILRARAQIQAQESRKNYDNTIKTKFQEKAVAARNRLMFCQSFMSRMQSNKNS